MTRLRDFWLKLSLTLSVLLPVYFVGSAMATKFQLVSWQIGFGLLVIQLGALVLAGTLVLALIGIVLSVVIKPRSGWQLGVVAAIIPAMGLAFAANVIVKARAVPPIHDISTDIVDPPVFSLSVALARMNIPGANAVDPMNVPLKVLPSYSAKPPAGLADKTVGELGRASNPDLTSMTLQSPVAEVTAAAGEVVTAKGLTLVRVDPNAGAVEAVAESFWFGFRDDVVIRVRPGAQPGTSVLDIRSASRVGTSDLGANAVRIKILREGIKARVAG